MAAISNQHNPLEYKKLDMMMLMVTVVSATFSCPFSWFGRGGKETSHHMRLSIKSQSTESYFGERTLKDEAWTPSGNATVVNPSGRWLVLVGSNIW